MRTKNKISIRVSRQAFW